MIHALLASWLNYATYSVKDFCKCDILKDTAFLSIIVYNDIPIADVQNSTLILEHYQYLYEVFITMVYACKL